MFRWLARVRFSSGGPLVAGLSGGMSWTCSRNCVFFLVGGSSLLPQDERIEEGSVVDDVVDVTVLFGVVGLLVVDLLIQREQSVRWSFQESDVSTLHDGSLLISCKYDARRAVLVIQQPVAFRTTPACGVLCLTQQLVAFRNTKACGVAYLILCSNPWRSAIRQKLLTNYHARIWAPGVLLVKH